MNQLTSDLWLGANIYLKHSSSSDTQVKWLAKGRVRLEKFANYHRVSLDLDQWAFYLINSATWWIPIDLHAIRWPGSGIVSSGNCHILPTNEKSLENTRFISVISVKCSCNIRLTHIFSYTSTFHRLVMLYACI